MLNRHKQTLKYQRNGMKRRRVRQKYRLNQSDKNSAPRTSTKMTLYRTNR